MSNQVLRAASLWVKDRYAPFRSNPRGEILPFEEAEYRDVISPFDGSRIASVGIMNEKQSLESLEVLLQTFLQRNIPRAFERIAILRKTAERVLAREAEFADLIAWEGGKPLKDALVEVRRAANSLLVAADEASRLHGSEIPMRATESASGHMAFTFHEPRGVVVAISAFNHPLNLIAHQIAPAIATGCPVLIKPASDTPLSCLHLLQEFYEAGLPAQMCLPMLTSGEIAEKIARHEQIGFVSFIGSAKVGWHLKSVIAPGVRFALEHGGAAPVIVDSSAQLETAIPSIVKAAFYHSGQVCVSTQRVFVDSKISDKFNEELVRQVKKLVTGDARLPETDCGPMIRPREVERIDSWVSAAVREGASLSIGGHRLSESCYQPTVLRDCSAISLVMTEEAFGPLVCVNTYQDLSIAIAQANNVRWSFQSAVYTSSLDVAMRCARELKASAVMVNEGTAFRVDWMPFRGEGPSGFSTGGIPYSMRDMTNEKMVVIQNKNFQI